ncbi:MAG: hypothetical protein HRF50_02690 [Phycisphaerae bacterium]|jgi:hypothetical protein
MNRTQLEASGSGRRRLPVRLALALACLFAIGAPAAYAQANTRVSRILGMFDINGKGGADQSVDSDADGLPDTWEVGGIDPENTDVPFTSPQAIVPGTPPVSLFARRAVRTSATSRDTDGDGLSDFIEVFGLMFIDDNGNGILDDATARDAAGTILRDANSLPLRASAADGSPAGEWFDINGDGMPSIGEWPAVNILVPGCEECFDFDGLLFTDPVNPDTDGDGVLDGADNDPLVNPASFGRTGDFFPSSAADPTDRDLDNDGLGNGMDLGNDVDRVIDNPQDLAQVLVLFREDLVTGVASNNIRVPEGLIEDLLGADWNGDGLFRLTDIIDPVFGLTLASPPSIRVAGNIELFEIEDPDDETRKVPLGFAVSTFPAAFNTQTYLRAAERGLGGIDAPLPFQGLLVPAGRDENVFLPDPRIWTVLYSWRMPGFDIDGNGFIGFDSKSFRSPIVVNGVTLDQAARENVTNVPSTEVLIAGGTSARASTTGTGGLDGQVDVSVGVCPFFGAGLLGAGLIGAWLSRPRVRRL